MNHHQQLIISALENMIGDDTHRARARFRNFTLEQMQEQHGESGKTRAQILAEYEAYDAKIRATIDWVKAL